MADRFVQQNAGPSGAEHDFHVAGRGFAGIKLEQRLAGGFLGKELRRLLAEKEIECNASAASGGAAGGVGIRFRDTRNIHTRERLRIFRKRAVGPDNQNVAQFVGIAGAHFFDARIVPAGGPVGAHQ